MNATWQGQWAVARQPWQRRRGSGGLGHRTSLLVLGLLLAVPAVGALWFGLLLPIFIGIATLVALTWHWWMTVDGLVRQNTPELARLLPGQARALRAHLLGQAALVLLVAFAALSLLTGPRLAGLWWAGGALVVLAWLLVEPWLWLVVWALPMVATWLGLKPAGWPAAVAAWPLPAQALLALLLLAALMAVLGQGGRFHRRHHRLLKSWERLQRAQAQGHPTPMAGQGPVLRALGACFTWPMGLYRRALLRRASPRNALQRLDLGLLAGGQWPVTLWLALFLGGGITLLLRALMGPSSADHAAQAIHSARFGLCVGGYMMILGPAMSRASMLWCRRREQALLVLLPGLPQGVALTAALESAWRREYLWQWLPATALVLAISAHGQPGTLSFAAAYAACCLPLAWVAQHQHRRMRESGRRPGPWPWILLPAAACALAGVAEWTRLPPVVSLAVGALAYALLAWRATPPAQALLPAGR